MNREEEIRIIAYHIWKEEGHNCHGSDIAHWLKAEAIWQGRNKPVRTAADLEPPTGDRQIDVTVKTQLASALSTQQHKKGQFSRRKP